MNRLLLTFEALTSSMFFSMYEGAHTFLAL